MWFNYLFLFISLSSKSSSVEMIFLNPLVINPFLSTLSPDHILLLKNIEKARYGVSFGSISKTNFSAFIHLDSGI